MAEWAGYDTGLEPVELWGWRDRIAADQPSVVVVVGSVGLALFVASVADSVAFDSLIIAVTSGGRATNALVVWVGEDPGEAAAEVLEMAQEEADVRGGGVTIVLDPALPGEIADRYLMNPASE